MWVANNVTCLGGRLIDTCVVAIEVNMSGGNRCGWVCVGGGEGGLVSDVPALCLRSDRGSSEE